MTYTDGQIEKKIQRLERESRVLRILAGFLLSLTCAILVMGQAPRTPEPESITICDDQGRIRIELALDPGGAPYISLQDENGITRAKLDANISGPGVHFRNADNSLLASLRIFGEDEPFLILCAGDGKVLFRAP
ncbi:MAG: hypothetical protein KJ831_10690 [Candidatus Eisenbacteria bacterium]|nr:hypothetical protein [Candidatus Eisenbacteria bacterium]